MKCVLSVEHRKHSVCRCTTKQIKTYLITWDKLFKSRYILTTDSKTGSEKKNLMTARKCEKHSGHSTNDRTKKCIITTSILWNDNPLPLRIRQTAEDKVQSELPLNALPDTLEKRKYPTTYWVPKPQRNSPDYKDKLIVENAHWNPSTWTHENLGTIKFQR